MGFVEFGQAERDGLFRLPFEPDIASERITESLESFALSHKGKNPRGLEAYATTLVIALSALGGISISPTGYAKIAVLSMKADGCDPTQKELYERFAIFLVSKHGSDFINPGTSREIKKRLGDRINENALFQEI